MSKFMVTAKIHLTYEIEADDKYDAIDQAGTTLEKSFDGDLCNFLEWDAWEGEKHETDQRGPGGL